ncbi:Kelch-like protein 20, partial [Ophiophagus hannah]
MFSFRGWWVEKKATQEHLEQVGGVSPTGIPGGVERYNPLDHEWQILGSVSRQRSGIGVASLNGSIYAAGGHDGLVCLNSVERYVPEINEWKRNVAPLSEPKQDVAMAELGGYLYCAGGFDGLVCLNTLERITYFLTIADSFQIRPCSGQMAEVGTYDVSSKRLGLGRTGWMFICRWGLRWIFSLVLRYILAAG